MDRLDRGSDTPWGGGCDRVTFPPDFTPPPGNPYFYIMDTGTEGTHHPLDPRDTTEGTPHPLDPRDTTGGTPHPLDPRDTTGGTPHRFATEGTPHPLDHGYCHRGVPHPSRRYAQSRLPLPFRMPAQSITTPPPMCCYLRFEPMIATRGGCRTQQANSEQVGGRGRWGGDPR